MNRLPELVMVGLSHHTAPIAVRERVAVAESRLEEVLAELRALPPILEAFVVSTCNRLEVYAATGGEPGAACRALRNYFSAQEPAVDEHLRQRQGHDAVAHLFRVCASLDSMVLGESQILGQVKSAVAAAERAGTLGGVLARSCSKAFAVAKRVRTETQVGAATVSMSFAAVELASKILGSLEGRTALLVGAGKMSALAARHLRGAGVSSLQVVNRSPERGRELAEEVEGEAFPWESLPQRLVEADVVVCSTAAPNPVISVELALAARKKRKHRPLFLVDLAVPRDVDPKVNELEGIFVYDVDDIDRVVGENLRSRQDEAARAEAIVEGEAKTFVAALRSEAGPIIRELRLWGDGIARAEAARTFARFGDELSEEQRRSIGAMAQAIVNKLLHEPTVRIRRAGEEEDGVFLDAALRLFAMEERPGASVSSLRLVAEERGESAERAENQADEEPDEGLDEELDEATPSERKVAPA